MLRLGSPLPILSFAEIAGTVLPTFSPREFFRPAQVDPFGNFNNVVIGDYHALRPFDQAQGRPFDGAQDKPGSGQALRLRLPGCGGIADVTVFSPRIYLYVPRHERRVFVERLDFRSGIGFLSGEGEVERRQRGLTGPGPRYLVSDLGQFDYVQGRMRLVSCHPGVSVAEVQAQTGFPLEIAPYVAETPPPTQEQVKLLREEIDPLGVRQLECLSGEKRRAALREIVEREETSTWAGPSK
ncbi:MAG: hypothetical protein E3J21_17390 [Anaerolineales bacterium]|nr:MAG: hypothetical protein E3J21_17390 [Anaerolineales bacterium]